MGRKENEGVGRTRKRLLQTIHELPIETLDRRRQLY